VSDSLSVQFLGDLSLDGLYTDPQHHSGLSDNLKWVSEFSTGIDFRVVNWESQLWGKGRVNEMKFPRLCTTKEAAKSTVSLNIDLALLANNHVFDNHIDGFRNTVKFFDSNMINYLGATEKKDEQFKEFIFNKNGIKIGIINYVGMETNPNLPHDCPVYVNIINENIVERISSLRHDVDHVVVILHWGEDESARLPNLRQRKLARELIDCGASIVVGHHVHCLQGFEEYKNGLICYSLGNFLFGPQMVYPGEIHSNRTADHNMAGLLNVNFTKDEFTFRWEYLMKKKNKLFLERDDGSVKGHHNRINKYMMYSDARLNAAYKFELVKIPIRNFIDKNGGLVRALMNVRMRQLNILKKILVKL
jgi:hypothetical protein